MGRKPPAGLVEALRETQTGDKAADQRIEEIWAWIGIGRNGGEAFVQGEPVAGLWPMYLLAPNQRLALALKPAAEVAQRGLARDGRPVRLELRRFAISRLN